MSCVRKCISRKKINVHVCNVIDRLTGNHARRYCTCFAETAKNIHTAKRSIDSDFGVASFGSSTCSVSDTETQTSTALKILSSSRDLQQTEGELNQLAEHFYFSPSVHSELLKRCGKMLLELPHIRRRYPTKADLTKSYLTHLSLFPPSLVLSALHYMYNFHLLLSRQRSNAKNMKYASPSCATKEISSSQEIVTTLVKRTENGPKSCKIHDKDLDRVRRFSQVLRVRIFKILPRCTVEEAAKMAWYWTRVRPKDTSLLLQVSQRMVKYLPKGHAGTELYAIVKPSTALQFCITMALCEPSCTSNHRRVAHALVPYVLERGLSTLTPSEAVNLLKLYSRLELRNGLLDILKRLCEMLENSEVSIYDIATAIHAVVQIPQTPSDVLVLLYHHLIQKWRKEESNTVRIPTSVFAPLHDLMNTEFSWWDNTYELVLSELEKKFVKAPRSNTMSPLSKEPHIRVQDAIKFSYALAMRESASPSHPFATFLLVHALKHASCLDIRGLQRLVTSQALLTLHGGGATKICEDMITSNLCPLILQKIESMERRATAHGLFLLGTYFSENITPEQRRMLLHRWLQLGPSFNSTLLAMSLHGISMVKPQLSEASQKSLADICDRKILRHLKSQEVLLVCNGLQSLGFTEPEPYFICRNRVAALVPEVSTAEVGLLLQCLDSISLTSTKIVISAIRRLAELIEDTPLETTLWATRVILSGISTERLYYGETLRRLQILLRREIISRAHNASSALCIALLNVCGEMAILDHALFRTVINRACSFEKEMISAIPKYSNHLTTAQESEKPHEQNSVTSLTTGALFTLLIHIPRYSLLERSIVFSLHTACLELQPSQLYHLLIHCIGPLQDYHDSSLSGLYASLYTKIRIAVFDALCTPQNELSPQSHRIRKLSWFTISQTILAMSNAYYCDEYLLLVMLLHAGKAYHAARPENIVEVLAAAAQLSIFRLPQFHFFFRRMKLQTERIAESFTSGEIRALLHILWSNGHFTYTRLVSIMGERALELEIKGY